MIFMTVSAAPPGKFDRRPISSPTPLSSNFPCNAFSRSVDLIRSEVEISRSQTSSSTLLVGSLVVCSCSAEPLELSAPWAFSECGFFVPSFRVAGLPFSHLRGPLLVLIAVLCPLIFAWGFLAPFWGKIGNPFCLFRFSVGRFQASCSLPLF